MLELDRPTPGAGALLWRASRHHAPILAVLVVGGLVRLGTMVAYRPAFEFVQDSFSYLYNADHLQPDVIRPIGYAVFLRILSVADPHFRVVPLAQHLLALGAGVLLYVVLRRMGAGRWLAAAGAAPLVLDGYQVALEHFVLSETLFEAFFVAAFALLLWREVPGWLAGGGAGLLLAATALTRTNGVVLLVPALGYLLLRRVPVKVLVAFLATWTLPLLAYVGWFHSLHGSYGIVAYDGYFLYGRVSPFADCTQLDLTADERRLCDPRAPVDREGSDWYVWNPDSPLRDPEMPQGVDREAVAQSFALKAITAQPVDYVRTVAGDLWHYVQPLRRTGPREGPAELLEFPTSFPTGPWYPATPPSDPYLWNWTWPGEVVQYSRIPASHGFHDRQISPEIEPGLARPLRAYQQLVHAPGPLLGLSLVLGLVAVRRLRSAPRRLVGAAVMLSVSGVLMWLVPAAASSFDYRYSLPVLALAPPAAVAGVLALRSPGEPADRRGPAAAEESGSGRPGAAGRHDERNEERAARLVEAEGGDRGGHQRATKVRARNPRQNAAPETPQ